MTAEEFEQTSEAVRAWIFDRAVGTGSARVFKDLVLSCFNGMAYSFDVGSLRILDSERQDLALNLIRGYLDHGLTIEMRDLALEIVRSLRP